MSGTRRPDGEHTRAPFVAMRAGAGPGGLVLSGRGRPPGGAAPGRWRGVLHGARAVSRLQADVGEPLACGPWGDAEELLGGVLGGYRVVGQGAHGLVETGDTGGGPLAQHRGEGDPHLLGRDGLEVHVPTEVGAERLGQVRSGDRRAPRYAWGSSSTLE